MIYFFSGTGNSEYIANILANKLSAKRQPRDIAGIVANADNTALMTAAAMPDGDHMLGLVMPVYAWGVPDVVEQFVARVLPQLVEGRRLDHTWCVFTHGDDMGYADYILRKRMEAVGLKLNAVFSLAMPNTYVCLPGFNIDPAEVANKKVRKAVEGTNWISSAIRNQMRCTDVVRGSCAFIKTYILRPLFNRFLATDKYFHIDKRRCTHCQQCVKRCPLHDITMENGAATWHGNCTSCLRCYHSCPTNAIHFGKFTQGKGQKQGVVRGLTNTTI